MDEGRKLFINDIIITAVEGGIDYWADIKSVANGREYWVREHNTGEGPGQWLHLAPNVVDFGIRSILNNKAADVRTDIIKSLLWANYTESGAEVDVEIADVIVQFALLGSIVYS